MAQEVRKQMVIAIPYMLLIQSADEEIGAIQAVEHPGPVSCWSIEFDDRLAQRPGKHVQNRSLQQELLDVFWLPVQHFLGQKVYQIVRILWKTSKDAARIGVVPQRNRRHLERSDPAFGALFKRKDRFWGKIESHRLAQKRRHL